MISRLFLLASLALADPSILVAFSHRVGCVNA
jgi:hypothetical protein